MAGLMLLAVLGAAWLGIAGSFVEALLAMALIGIGCSPVLMGSMYLFGRVYPAERFAMMSSLIIGFGSLGNLLGATPLALAVQALGWRPTMEAIAGLTALSAGLVFWLLKDPPQVSETGQGGRPKGGLMDIVRLRPLWLLLPLTLTSYSAVIAIRSLWIAPFFAQVHGFDVTARGNAALVMAVAMTAGALLYGPLERLVGHPKITALAGSVFTGLCLVVLGVYGAASAALALVLLALVGAAGMSYAILMAHGRLFFPAHLLGRGVTFLNFAFIGGAGMVQWLSGQFVQAGRDAGTPAETVFGQLHVAFGAALLLAAALYALAPAKPKARA
jgi:predicted MFS family arabinose efflux permease